MTLLKPVWFEDGTSRCVANVIHKDAHVQDSNPVPQQDLIDGVKEAIKLAELERERYVDGCCAPHGLEDFCIAAMRFDIEYQVPGTWKTAWGIALSLAASYHPDDISNQAQWFRETYSLRVLRELKHTLDDEIHMTICQIQIAVQGPNIIEGLNSKTLPELEELLDALLQLHQSFEDDMNDDAPVLLQSNHITTTTAGRHDWPPLICNSIH